MSYNQASLPTIKLISLKNEPKEQLQPQGNIKTGENLISTDKRWNKAGEFLRSNDLSPNTYKLYEREIKRFLGWTQLPYEELRPRHIVQYKEYLMALARTDNDKPLSNSSINAALATIKSFCKWLSCAYPEIMQTNPALGIRLEKVSLPPVESLTPEEMQKVWTALELLGETKQRDMVLIHILSHGLRASEVVNLNISSFDGRLLVLPGVRKKESRLVPLRLDSQAVITDYLRSRTLQGEELMDSSPLLISYHNLHKGVAKGGRSHRLSYHGIYFAVEKIGEIAGIKNLHPHAFRQTYTTSLLLLGVDPTHVRQLTGHQSEKGFRRYTQISQQTTAISAYYQAMEKSEALTLPEGCYTEKV